MSHLLSCVLASMEGVEDVVHKRDVGNQHQSEQVLLETRKHPVHRKGVREQEAVVVLEDIEQDPKDASCDKEQPQGALRGGQLGSMPSRNPAWLETACSIVSANLWKKRHGCWGP